MIYQGTYMRVIDNSGALTAMCVKVLHKAPTSPAYLGDKVIVVVKTVISGKRVARSQLHRALIVWSPVNLRRKEGTYIKFAVPACVLLKKDGQPLANRVRGPVYRELRALGHLKIVSIASIAL